jgi:hypothetical protein
MEQQFQKLEDTILNQVDRYFFFTGMPGNHYVGPVHPTSLISYSLDYFDLNALVLAEAVPAKFFPAKYSSILYDAVIVLLDRNFEFKMYDAAGKGLYELNLLIGDPKYSYDGTVEGAKTFFEKHNSILSVLYKRDYGVTNTIDIKE